MTTTNTTGETFDLRPQLRIVLRYKYLIVTFCVSAAITSLALTYVLSEKFVAYATVLYQPNEAVTFRPKDREALGFPTPTVSLESIGNTLDELAKSDSALEQVVRELRLDVKRPRPPSNVFVTAFHAVKDTAKEYGGNTWELMRYGRILEKDPFAQAMAQLRKNLNIRRTAKAYTFQLEVVDTDPALAARIADQVAETLALFLEQERLRLARETSESLAARLAENEQETIALRTRLGDYRKDAKVSSLSEELSLKLKTVAGFHEEAARARNELQALQMKRSEQQRQLDQQEQSVKYDSTSTQNPVAEEMRMELAKLEVERSGLIGKFTAEHQDVKSVDAKIAQVQRKLASESSRVVASESTRANDIYQKLLSARLETDADIEATAARLNAYDSSIGRETGVAQQLMSKEQGFAELALQVAGAEHSYVLISEAFEEARIAESKAASELSIVHQAFIPRAPAWPIKVLHVGVSAALSALLAVGLAFLVTFFDTSIRRVDQIERILNIPVLATIPAVPSTGAGVGLVMDRRRS